MRKVTRTLAIALLLAGSAALTADARTSRGAGEISSAAQNFTPIEQVACRGWGPYCQPGFTRVCGPYRCWVPPLLVTHAPATGPSRSAALVASVCSEMSFLPSRGVARRALRADC